MKLYKLCFVSLLFIVSCGKSNSNQSIPSLSVEQNKIYFMTSDYSSQLSYLYSLDVKEHHIALEPAHFTKNIGINGFQSRDEAGNLQNLYISEDMDGQPARVTIYRPSGLSSQNTTDLPQDIHDILNVNHSLYFLGYDKKEIAISDFLLNSMTLPKTTIETFDSDSSKIYDPNNFSAILNQDEKFYILTAGYTPYKTTTATIFQLNTNLISSPVKTWPIQKDGIICYNLSSTLRLQNNKLVASCNPAWEILPPDIHATPALFLIDVSSSLPVITLLTTAQNTSELTLGGISFYKNYILVTESKYEQDYDKYTNPTVLNAYWLNIANPLERLNSKGAFAVTYNKNTNSYLFSCLLNAANQCERHTFAIASASQESLMPSPQGEKALLLDHLPDLYHVRTISFFKEL